MNNRIELEKRSNYGVEMFYVTSEHASAIRSLTGRITVSSSDVKALGKLGFTVVVTQKEEVLA